MKIQWEYDLVERAFCEQLRAMGWQWIEGDTDIPDFTERPSFREVFLKGRLVAALGSSTCGAVNLGWMRHGSHAPFAIWSSRPGTG